MFQPDNFYILALIIGVVSLVLIVSSREFAVGALKTVTKH